MMIKYKKKMCFAFGVAVIENEDGTVEGRRYKMIDYTGKVVVSEKEEKEELART